MKLVILLLLSCSTIFATSSLDNPSEEFEHPDIHLTVEEYIVKYGYPVERHEITTEDGYILTAYRIPYGINGPTEGTRPVAWLQHGLLGSCMDWLYINHDKAFAFIMADNGYDVWLGNARGNRHSRKHISLTTEDDQFWDFSFHEMGLYDVPADIDYVIEKTGVDQIYWFGHSMGSCQFFIAMAERPEYNSKVKLMSGLAPALYIHNMQSPIALLAPFANTLLDIWAPYFLPGPGLPDWVPDWVGDLIGIPSMKDPLVFYNGGGPMMAINETQIPLFWAHNPAGVSTKTIVHYAQSINYKTARKFNYGPLKNVEKYGALTPPEYDMKKVTVPVAVYYGQTDFFVDTKDIEVLVSKLPNVVHNYAITRETFNHFDFIVAVDAPELLYHKVLEFNNNYMK